MLRNALISLHIFLLLFAASELFAQGPYFNEIELPSEFDELQMELVTQCADGYIWVGTDHGVYRYDGSVFQQVLLPGDSLDQDVTAIFAESSDTIWIGYRSGQMAFLSGGELKVFSPPEGNPKSRITDILVDDNGDMWYSTYGEGLYIYHHGRVYNISMDDGLSDDFVYCLEAGPNGSIWAGTDKGINMCGFADGQKSIRKLSSQQGLPDNIVTALQFDGDSAMIAGMYKQGACLIDVNTLAVEPLFQEREWHFGPVSDLLHQQNEIWILTGQNEIVQYTTRQPSYIRVYDNRDGLPAGGFKRISHDDEGNIWILGTPSTLIRVNTLFEIIARHEDKDFTDVHALLADSKGYLWFFNQKDLIRHSIEFTGRNTARVYSLPLRDQMPVISLFEDAMGMIWAGTFGDGVYRIDPESGNYLHLTSDNGLVDDNILSISGDGETIWFSTLGGVSHLQFTKNGSELSFETFNKSNGLGNNYVYYAHADKQGRIWFATDGNGIVRLNNGQFTSFSENTGHLKSSVVYSITEDVGGNIWFSTLKEGIYRYDGQAFSNFNMSNGLTDPNITSLIADGKNNLIIVHRKGIDIYDIDADEFSYYSEAYGLDDINPDLNTASVDINGDIWLGSRKALIKYSLPDTSLRNRPRTVLNDPFVFLEDFTFNKDHALDAGKNHLTFQYKGLWYQNPEAVTYQYILEGYDPEWVITKDESVIYPNLPPGHYKFQVRSAVNGNFDGAANGSFEFRVRPPFWKHGWFLACSAFILIALFYYFISTRVSRIKKRERRERERILLEFENLKSQVNPHFLFNSFNSLVSVIEEDQEEAVEYVEKLSRFFRNILTYRDMDLIKLREELKVAEDYFFIHQQRYGQLVRMEINVEEADLERMIPPLTLQILIENAIKHNVISKASPLAIRIGSDSHCLTVSNRIARKRSKADSTGTGLHNIRNRYRLLTDRSLGISDGPEEFIVTVPLLNQPI